MSAPATPPAAPTPDPAHGPDHAAHPEEKRQLNKKGWAAIGLLVAAAAAGTMEWDAARDAARYQEFPLRHPSSEPSSPSVSSAPKSQGAACDSDQRGVLKEAGEKRDELYLNRDVQKGLGSKMGSLDEPRSQKCAEGVNYAARSADGKTVTYGPDYFADQSKNGDCERAAIDYAMSACFAGFSSKSCVVGGAVEIDDKGELPIEIQRAWTVVESNCKKN